MLCLQVADAFVGEVLCALRAGTLSCPALLQFLPLSGEVQGDFFTQAANSIMQRIQQEACIQTASGQYSKPASTLLPEPLLQLQDGQPLFINSWLQAGSPGLEYISPGVLDSSGGNSDSSGGGIERVQAALQQLGCRSFSADLLVQLLTAGQVKVQLEGLPGDELHSWLRGLYTCLEGLTGLPKSHPMGMANAEEWSSSLGEAPVLPLYGQQALTSYRGASSAGRLFLWDPNWGGEKELSLFGRSSSSGADSDGGGGGGNSHTDRPLQFVDPAVQTPQLAVVLGHFFGTRTVPLSVLVEDLLQQQEICSLTLNKRKQLLLFLVHNQQQVLQLDDVQDTLRKRLQLQTSAMEADEVQFALGPDLWYPLGSGAVPAVLQRDLMQAGVEFLHPWFEQLLQGALPESAGAGAASARNFLQALGITELSAEDAVTACCGYMMQRQLVQASGRSSTCSTWSLWQQHTCSRPV